MVGATLCLMADFKTSPFGGDGGVAARGGLFAGMLDVGSGMRAGHESTTSFWLRHHPQPPPRPSPRGGSKNLSLDSKAAGFEVEQASPLGEVVAKQPEGGCL